MTTKIGLWALKEKASPINTLAWTDSGQLASVIDSAGQVTRNTYDAQDRIQTWSTSGTLSRSGDIAFSYDILGNRIRIRWDMEIHIHPNLDMGCLLLYLYRTLLRNPLKGRVHLGYQILKPVKKRVLPMQYALHVVRQEDELWRSYYY